jgi:uncharacterized protein YyaL (SSP411 family)
MARAGAKLSRLIILNLLELIARAYDPLYGGFGKAPKFPQPEVNLLLIVEYVQSGRQNAKLADMVQHTLRTMADSGLYDQVEGGWFRYSTTCDWSIPHFEKMLEDHARLIPVYLYASEVLRDERLKEAAIKGLEYVKRTLYEPELGVFWGSQEADEEYYALSLKERMMRPPPAVDRTIYTNWNAQMALALLISADMLGDAQLREMAIRNLDSVWALAFDPSTGALYHYVDIQKKGALKLLGDQVHYARAALAAFQRTGERRFLERAIKLRLCLESSLADWEGGGFYDRPAEPQAIGALRIRQKPLEENAFAAELYLTFHELTSDRKAREIAERILLAFEREYMKYGFNAA